MPSFPRRAAACGTLTDSTILAHELEGLSFTVLYPLRFGRRLRSKRATNDSREVPRSLADQALSRRNLKRCEPAQNTKSSLLSWETSSFAEWTKPGCRSTHSHFTWLTSTNASTFCSYSVAYELVVACLPRRWQARQKTLRPSSGCSMSIGPAKSTSRNWMFPPPQMPTRIGGGDFRLPTR